MPTKIKLVVKVLDAERVKELEAIWKERSFWENILKSTVTNVEISKDVPCCFYCHAEAVLDNACYACRKLVCRKHDWYAEDRQVIRDYWPKYNVYASLCKECASRTTMISPSRCESDCSDTD